MKEGLASGCEWLFDKLPFLIEFAFFLLLPLLLYHYIAYVVGGNVLRAQGKRLLREMGRLFKRRSEALGRDLGDEALRAEQAEIAESSASAEPGYTNIAEAQLALTEPKHEAPFVLPPRKSHTLHLKPRMTAERWAQVALWVLIALLASRLLVLVAGQLGQVWRGEGGFFDLRLDRYVRWDAHHYIRLARDWYVNEGDPRFHIVFFPLYPLMLRAANALFPIDTAVLGIILSNIFLYLGGLTLYELMRVTYDDKIAIRSVALFMLSPLTVFMSIPYGESLFVLMTLLSVLMARKRRFVWAVVFGALAANTRMLGILTAAPIFLEMMDASMETQDARPGARLLSTLRCALMASLVLIGLGAYLLLNWQVTGDPFKFLIYQREHWSQQFGSIGNTMSYSLALASTKLAEDNWYAYTTWIPQVASVMLLIALVYGVRKRLNPGDGAYAWLYIWAAIAPTWLLSGPRYLMALYALYPALALVSRSRVWFAAMLAVLTILLCYFTALYVGVGLVL